MPSKIGMRLELKGRLLNNPHSIAVMTLANSFKIKDMLQY